ncbi:MAG TPA: methyltransferase [Pirellulales bacterium]|nr:methyltransferase [Pirellulales bacterium]
MLEPLKPPNTDPTPVFEAFRGSYGTELLTAAVAHFDLFGRLAEQPLVAEELAAKLGLEARPAVVLFTALRAMGLLTAGADGRLDLTPLAREHLLPGGEFDVGAYIGLAAESPGVLTMVERLRTNRAPGMGENEDGAAFIYRDGIRSAMDQEASARHLTLALAGRAKNVAPVLAERLPLDGSKLLLDVGGGSGMYAVTYLRRCPKLKAIVWDRAEVLKVAREMADAYQVSDRLECRPGDMFADPLPDGVDSILLSNVLHDWDVPDCRRLVARSAAALPPGGRLLIHDVFLNDALDGPLAVALYSAALFSITEGRAYSAAEYREWLLAAGLQPQPIVPTLIHCGVLEGRKLLS